MPRPHRLSISKLCHNLWNTNEQNQKYYHQDGTCPFCPTLEMQTHIYSCKNSAAQEIREGAIATLQQTLQTAGTPQQLSTLLTDMLQSSTPPPIVDPTSRAIVTAQLQIGWHGLHRGHLSKEWRNAYLASLPAHSKCKSERAHTWGGRK
jgi:hypothetical protein